MTDYERGVNQASDIYKKVIREYVAENAKLRSELESVGTAAYLYGRDQLKTENAKLRELARDLRFCARQSICLKCEHGRICDLRLDERCAELRIEVAE